MPIAEFISRAIPTKEMVLWLLPVTIVYTILSAGIAGYLRRHRNIRTPYTRKIFHLLIFTLAGLLHLIAGFPAVMVLGTVVAVAVLFAVYKGAGFPFYEAMARPSDAPKRSLFILIPLLTTALGGVTTNLLFPAFAGIGYFIGGFGDAVGEPVGTKWGRHKYRVMSIAGVKAERSLEGSFAVCIMSFLAASCGLMWMGFSVAGSLKVGILCAVAATLVEAVSNHGLDNFTIQIAGAGVAHLMLN